jgi:hypothetical protein
MGCSKKQSAFGVHGGLFSLIDLFPSGFQGGVKKSNK